jgi:hypothetical protein
MVKERLYEINISYEGMKEMRAYQSHESDVTNFSE